MLKQIWQATKKGWLSGGIEWREQFVEKGINPDKFLTLPDSNNLLDQYLRLTPQSKVQFLNMLTRNKAVFDVIKID